MLMRREPDLLQAEVAKLADVFTVPVDLDAPVTRARAAMREANQQLTAAHEHFNAVAKQHQRHEEDHPDLKRAEGAVEAAAKRLRKCGQELAKAQQEREDQYRRAVLTAFKTSLPALENVCDLLNTICAAITPMEAFGTQRALSPVIALWHFRALQEGARALTGIVNASGGKAD